MSAKFIMSYLAKVSGGGANVQVRYALIHIVSLHVKNLFHYQSFFPLILA